jgi:hypothetical protein
MKVLKRGLALMPRKVREDAHLNLIHDRHPLGAGGVLAGVLDGSGGHPELKGVTSESRMTCAQRRWSSW